MPVTRREIEAIILYSVTGNRSVERVPFPEFREYAIRASSTIIAELSRRGVKTHVEENKYTNR
ncbi:MAG TPA: hypothetical protein VLH56_19625 [Dissulfurispiraceae bacterium]|nr:hypothetical protein [Dissulfurispiraceae bacterium]